MLRDLRRLSFEGELADEREGKNLVFDDVSIKAKQAATENTNLIIMKSP